MKRNGNDNDRRENLCYIEADKPLVYNFFDVKTLQELIDKEPTSGKKMRMQVLSLRLFLRC